MNREPDEFDQVLWGDLVAGVQQLCDNLGFLDASIVKAIGEGDQAAMDVASSSASSVISQIPWGTIPTLLMALARQVNTERAESIEMVQQWYLEARVIEEALKILATLEAVPVVVLANLSKAGDRMDAIVAASKYASTVEK